jgi:hypothetical protein
MKSNIGIILAFLALLIVVGVAYRTYDRTPGEDDGQNPPMASSTSPFEQSISDGTITINYSDTLFGLAVRTDQILVTSYIPPCDVPFGYCFYYNDSEYDDTNLDSAGIRFYKRDDLATEQACLETPPAGFDSMEAKATSTAELYAASVFSPMGDAGAGHYANGSQYRLFVRKNSACYEIETRIAQTQFANYPAGSIEEFTASDQRELENRLDRVIDSIELDGQKNLFGSL